MPGLQVQVIAPGRLFFLTTVVASVDSRLGGIGPASLIPSRHINPVSLEMLAVAFGS